MLGMGSALRGAKATKPAATPPKPGKPNVKAAATPAKPTTAARPTASPARPTPANPIPAGRSAQSAVTSKVAAGLRNQEALQGQARQQATKTDVARALHAVAKEIIDKYPKR